MKKLYKITNGKKICGVCGGFAEYFNIDVTLIRILWLSAVLCAGFGLIAYFICAICMPKKEDVGGSDY